MKLYLVGYAFGLGGVGPESGEGPVFLQKSPFLSELIRSGISYEWEAMIQQPQTDNSLRADEQVRKIGIDLANKIAALVRDHKSFCVIGGDHTSAIGTWSGVFAALREQGEIGLIWIDAHMDSHTPETTETGRIHGMPLACLMGYGYPTLTSVLSDLPKLKPENVCLIGVRSFERGEAELLQRLHVRTYLMEEIKERGFVTVLREAVEKISKNTVAYGISIDLDSLDPAHAPGVDVPEADGIKADDFCKALSLVAADPKWIGTEIVEFNPYRDKDHQTEKLIVTLLSILGKAK